MLALAQPNRMRRREVQVPYLSLGFGDFEIIVSVVEPDGGVDSMNEARR